MFYTLKTGPFQPGSFVNISWTNQENVKLVVILPLKLCKNF